MLELLVLELPLLLGAALLQLHYARLELACALGVVLRLPRRRTETSLFSEPRTPRQLAVYKPSSSVG